MSAPPLPDVDYSATSSRPSFESLPPEVRVAIGDAVRGVVVDAAPPVGSGFTGAYAGLLALADGRRVFAKAAGPTMPHVVAGLAAEERILPLLAHLRCASRLGDRARHGPRRMRMRRRSPASRSLPCLRKTPLAAPGRRQLDDLVALAARAEQSLEGESLVHCDVRPDNLLVEPSGTARLVDWNHASCGAPWVDLVGLWP